jgi:hypothetical protein
VRKLVLLYPALAVLFVTAVLGVNCDLFSPNDAYVISLNNLGRDPIHVLGTRFADNTTKHLTDIGGDYIDHVELEVTRMDIELGTLRLVAVADPVGLEKITITMTEPTYFDLVFTSSDPAKVSVTFDRP